jgi:hypothetical protein
MTGLRSAAYPGAAYSLDRRPPNRRVMAHFAVDLAATIGAVLALGWLFQASANEYALRNALVTQNEIYVAISRFTPENLLFSYIYAAGHAVRGQIFTYGPSAGLSDILMAALIAICQMVVNLAFAVPRTLSGLYQETSGIAAWIVLAGFGFSAATVIISMFWARASIWRLLVGAAISPVAISVVFLALQGFMVLMLDAFFWFTSLAPYTVACPVVCTLYWVVFPNAERGATAAVAHVVLRVIEPHG